MTRDWYAERDPGDEEHPVDFEVTQHLESARPEYVALLARIDATTRKLRAALGVRGRLWLELEALLNDRASMREAAYYNLGVDEGRALEALGDTGTGTDLEQTLRVAERLASAIATLAHEAREGLATDGPERS